MMKLTSDLTDANFTVGYIVWNVRKVETNLKSCGVLSRPDIRVLFFVFLSFS